MNGAGLTDGGRINATTMRELRRSSGSRGRIERRRGEDDAGGSIKKGGQDVFQTTANAHGGEGRRKK
jgi:hypothetical protein